MHQFTCFSVHDDVCYINLGSKLELLTRTRLLWQILIELPYILLQTLLYSLITYAMIGLEWTAVKFCWYFFFMFFTFLYFSYYGMMAVALTPNHQLASIVAAFFYSIFNLFSGFLVTKTVSRSNFPKATFLQVSWTWL